MAFVSPLTRQSAKPPLRTKSFSFITEENQVHIGFAAPLRQNRRGLVSLLLYECAA